MSARMPDADLLLEISWEVCNKVGGINTVIRSKMPRILELYGNSRYIAIGPYIPSMIPGEFEESPIPAEYEQIYRNLAAEGIILHFGKWLIKGLPTTILVDFKNYFSRANDIKKDLWDKFGISSIRAPFDYDEPVVWSYASGRAIQLLLSNFKGKKVVAQFHEWLSGAGLLYLKANNSQLATVFTTHATILGRTLASSDVDLYTKLKTINPEQEAYNYGIEAKFGIEKQSAVNSTVFTTVSEITGMEAEHFLGRKPEVLLPNGLDMDKFPTFEEASVQHRIMKSKIFEFISFYFFPYYTFDLENTLIFFLAGRYEFRDKGIDIFIHSLTKLNQLMKEKKSPKTIVAFIWVPADAYSIYPDLIANRMNFSDIKEGLEDAIPAVKNRILMNLIAQREMTSETIFDQSFVADTKKKVLKFKKQGMPELSTHQLKNNNDIIINTLRSAGLNNSKENPVKIIFYPIYLTGADGLIDLTYYECMQGSHLGVFPSFYEPWGYTPLEAAALGVSSVTTDLAGFGRYIIKDSDGKKIPGIFVLKRENKTDDEIISSLTKFMFTFSTFSMEDRVKNKIAAKAIASKADWKYLIGEYIKAHNLAVGGVRWS